MNYTNSGVAGCSASNAPSPRKRHGVGLLSVSAVLLFGLSGCAAGDELQVHAACPTGGACVDGRCGDGTFCQPGVCDDSSACVDGRCSNGLDCRPGVCADGSSCQGGVCNDGSMCEPAACRDGSECVDGVCSDSSPCAPGVCDDGSTCVDGACDDGTSCVVGGCNVGQCNNGTCSDGTVCACMPSAEVCNGRDDDCDGMVDEEAMGAGDACSTGAAGICGGGVQVCVAGGTFSCMQTVTPQPEVCNGVDDSCDGAVDEGCPNGALELFGGTEATHWMGGSGGSPFQTECLPGWVLVGVHIRSGTRVDGIAPQCQQVRIDNNGGNYQVVRHGAIDGRAYRGGGGGSLATLMCPDNEVVTGIFGRSGNEVDALGVECSRLSVNGSPGNFSIGFSPGARTGQAGGGGGGQGERDCPGGMASMGVGGRAGLRLDQVYLLCRSVRPGVL